MTFFAYKNGRLQAEEVDLERLAAEVGTPFYCYASGAIEQAYSRLSSALEGLPAGIYYALKANSNQAVIATLARLGAGADVVSVGEMYRALAAGIPANRIIFAGVGKTAEELTAALEAGIHQFNVESLEELERLSAIAAGQGMTAPVALRVNPDVDAGTHRHISTGMAENKFGIAMDLARQIAARPGDYPGVRIVGLAIHIGSQLTDIAPYRKAFERLIGLFRELRETGLPLQRLDFGGGLGISYRDENPPSMEDYARLAREVTRGLDAELAFEPGRSMVGEAGILVSKVVYLKTGQGRRFVVLDAAMNDIIRPMLYEAWHEFLPLREPAAGEDLQPVDIVGPICESTDTFAKQRPLPPLQEGDLIAIMSAGAYGAVMSSTYNTRLLVPEVMVRASRHALVRPRGDYASLIAQDRLPDWLAPEQSTAIAGA